MNSIRNNVYDLDRIVVVLRVRLHALGSFILLFCYEVHILKNILNCAIHPNLESVKES